jgi:hypothetical protein
MPNRTARVFSSFEAAAQADIEYYAALTPEECLDIQLDIIAAYRESMGEAAQRFERVCRITELSRN